MVGSGGGAEGVVEVLREVRVDEYLEEMGSAHGHVAGTRRGLGDGTGHGLHHGAHVTALCKGEQSDMMCYGIVLSVVCTSIYICEAIGKSLKYGATKQYTV